MAVLAVATVAQAPQSAPAGPPPEGGMRHEHSYPAPTNLQVLPKDLTGAQVREIMHHWAGDLGTGCDTCHAEYADHRTAPNGHPMLDFASDAKPDKRMARIMAQMTMTDKKDFIPKVQALDTMGSPVAPLTCGTCHRGHLDPEAYVPPKHEEHGPHPEGAPGAPPPGN